MDLTQIALEVLLLVTILAQSKSMHFPNDDDGLYIKAEKEVHKDNKDDNSNCFCFPKVKSSKYVNKVLDPEDEGLERLVVYFYKKKNSNKINMFTPGPDKQDLLPELPFEADDDLLTVTKETLSGIFHTNPSVIETNKNNLKQNKSHHTEPDKSKHHNLHFIESNPNSDSDDLEYINKHDFYDTNNAEPLSTHHRIPDSHDSEDYPSITKEDIDKNEVHKEKVYSSLVHPWSKKIITIDSQKYNPNLLKRYPWKIDKESYKTFDKWFLEQITRFHNLNSGNANINLKMLKNLIEKTLRENHMHVTTEGILTDSHGAILDLGNVILRPILIGNSIGYRTLIKEISDKFAFSKHSPYLQAVLVTLGYPRKVLGMIPVGTTVLPEEHMSEFGSRYLQFGIPKMTKTSKITKTHCNSKGCTTKIVNGNNLIDEQIDFLNDKKVSDYLGDKNNFKLKQHKIKFVSKLKNKDFKELGPQNDYYIKALLGPDDNKNLFEEVSKKEIDDENPAFRIIGGTHATNSGAALNNKGRSGSIFGD